MLRGEDPLQWEINVIRGKDPVRFLCCFLNTKSSSVVVMMVSGFFSQVFLFVDGSSVGANVAR
jgi:hypothetical protein